MVSIIRQHYFLIPLFVIFVTMLTGCPGDRWRFDELAIVSTVKDNVCFSVPDASDYQPVSIAINPRGTPSKEQRIIFDPELRVANGQLCIPPSFYFFPENGQFIVSYILHSENHKETPRKLVAGMGILNGCVFNITLTDMEIVRPYSEMKNNDITSVQDNHTNSCEHTYPSAPLN